MCECGQRRKPFWRWIVILAMMVALPIASRFLPIREWGGSFTEWIESRGLVGYGALFIAFALGSPLFVPGWVLTIAAGVAFGMAAGTAVALAGSTAGATITFLIGRYLVRGRIEKWARGNARFRAVDEAISENGWKIVALLRLTPVIPFSLVNYLLALTQVRTCPFIFATLIGLIPGVVLHVYVGYAGRAALMDGERSTVEYVYLGAGLAAAIGLMLYVARLAKKRLSGSSKPQ